MLWDVPVEGRYLGYGTALAALCAAAVAACALFAYEVAKRRVPLRPGAAGLLLAGIAACAAAFVGLVAAVAQGHPAWDRIGSDLLAGASAGPLRPLVQAFALLGSFPFTLLALFGLFVWMLKRERWTEAYVALASGGGLAGLLLVLKLLLPRVARAPQLFFTGATAFPNDSAALAPAFLAIFLFLRRRVGTTNSTNDTNPSFVQFVKFVVWWVAVALLAFAPVMLGQAWLSDALAGLLLAGLWLLLSYVGLLLVEEGLAPGNRSLLLRALDRADAGARRVVARPVPWLLAAIAVGVLLRLVSSWWTPLGVDAFVYAVMGNQLLHTGSFTMPWGDVHTYLTAPVPSHHYPPLYPLYLAGFYRVLGFSQSTTHVAAIVSSLGALLATWLCTRDLYGPRKALVATAAVALSPLFVQNTGQGYSENLVLLLFVATLWSILKSLERPWHILPAGILAGLGYLTKSSMGYFFVVAGLGGLAWRLHWKGLRVLRDPAYLAAILAFGALVAGWAVRNALLFGSWETSQHISAAYHHALAHPLQWGFLALVTFVLYATVGYLVFLALLPWLPRLAKMPKLETEHDSGLWLALGLPLLLTAAIDAALWLTEREFFINNVRYVGFVAVPAVWLLLRHLDLRPRAVRLAAVGTFLLLLTGSLLFAKPGGSSIQAIADDLGPRMQDGDSVAWVDTNVHGIYRFYFQLTRDGTRAVPVAIACAADPLCPPDTPGPGTLDTTWVLMEGDGAALLPPHYVPVPDSPAQYDPRFPEYMSLWRHT
ncbi:MAG: glycosyltransferase family 39 protein [Halobacteriales archaeon]|nr:glycosyltransferase family 39 protein [Halobacteriales archaeon]